MGQTAGAGISSFSPPCCVAMGRWPAGPEGDSSELGYTLKRQPVNPVSHFIGVCHDLNGGDAIGVYALICQPLIAVNIADLVVIQSVLRSINFDGEFSCGAIKIKHIRANRVCQIAFRSRTKAGP